MIIRGCLKAHSHRPKVEAKAKRFFDDCLGWGMGHAWQVRGGVCMAWGMRGKGPCLAGGMHRGGVCSFVIFFIFTSAFVQCEFAIRAYSHQEKVGAEVKMVKEQEKSSKDKCQASRKIFAFVLAVPWSEPRVRSHRAKVKQKRNVCHVFANHFALFNVLLHLCSV